MGKFGERSRLCRCSPRTILISYPSKRTAVLDEGGTATCRRNPRRRCVGNPPSPAGGDDDESSGPISRGKRRPSGKSQKEKGGRAQGPVASSLQASPAGS
jgi:hypothetical protein